jgi:hypothetical protein
MTNDTWQQCLKALPLTAISVIEVMDDNEMIKVKSFNPCKELEVKFAIMGLEIKMGWETGVVEGWSPQYFGEVMNTLIAEYFGEGTVTSLKEWHQASKRLMEGFTEEAYQQYGIVDTTVLKNFLSG